MSNDIFISEDPIFIVGFPRSGTTLLQLLLSNAPETKTLPETHFFTTLRIMGYFDNGNFDKDFFEERISRFLGLEYSLPRKYFILEQGINYKILKELFESVISCYFENHSKKSTFRLIEKTPGHLKHVRNIYRLYPKAKFIYIRRNPLNAIQSFINKLPGGKQKDIIALARKWQAGDNLFREFFKENIANCYVISYEELITNPHKELLDLSDFLGFSEFECDLSNLNRKELFIQEESWKTNDFEKGDIRRDETEIKWTARQLFRLIYVLEEEIAKNNWISSDIRVRFIYYVVKVIKTIYAQPITKSLRPLLKIISKLFRISPRMNTICL